MNDFELVNDFELDLGPTSRKLTAKLIADLSQRYKFIDRDLPIEYEDAAVFLKDSQTIDRSGFRFYKHTASSELIEYEVDLSHFFSPFRYPGIRSMEQFFAMYKKYDAFRVDFENIRMTQKHSAERQTFRLGFSMPIFFAKPTLENLCEIEFMEES